MKLLHVTSPEIALMVAKSGVFLCQQIEGDRGLNALLLDGNNFAPNQSDANHFQANGAFMVFKWDGPQGVLGKNFNVQPDTIYDLRPHRLFIPAGTTRHLRLVELELKQGYQWPSAKEVSIKNIEKFVADIPTYPISISIKVNLNAY